MKAENRRYHVNHGLFQPFKQLLLSTPAATLIRAVGKHTGESAHQFDSILHGPHRLIVAQ